MEKCNHRFRCSTKIMYLYQSNHFCLSFSFFHFFRIRKTLATHHMNKNNVNSLLAIVSTLHDFSLIIWFDCDCIFFCLRMHVIFNQIKYSKVIVNWQFKQTNYDKKLIWTYFWINIHARSESAFALNQWKIKRQNYWE